MNSAMIKVVIPARYASTRLPGKPLADIAGMPMIVRTARNAALSGFDIVVAYDDERIGKALSDYQISCIRTKDTHENGTQRLSEVAQLMGWDEDVIVVNVQGDEPLLPATLIENVADCLAQHKKASVATLATPFVHDDPLSPNSVKVVLDRDNYALYFSRRLIPYVRDEQADVFPYLRHIGIYAYRVKALLNYPNMETTPLENAEKLEQIRFLEYGYRIAVNIIEEAPPAGVDSADDLVRVNRLLRDAG